jgi:Tol biopolymer transport system component
MNAARLTEPTPTSRRTHRSIAPWFIGLGALALALCILGGRTGQSAEADIIVVVPGCVVDPADVLGWWPGEGDLTAAIGPDLTGTSGFGAGLFSGGLSLDPSSELSAAALGTVSTGLTIEMWMKPAAGTQGRVQTLASRWAFPGPDDAARSYNFTLDAFNTLSLSIDDVSARRPVELRVSVPQLFDGEFHHVAATWDVNSMVIYVDGFAAATRAWPGGLVNAAANVPFALGRTGGLGDPLRFSGIIDEAAVIRRALTPAEVESLVGAGPNGKCIFATTTGVVGPGLAVPADLGGVDPVISANGRFVLFRTRSTNILPVVNDPALQVPGTDLDLFSNSRDDLVLLDTNSSGATGDDTLELVSVGSDELGGRLDSFMGDMSPSASHIVFSSISDDLVPGDTLAGTDVFVRNRVAGTTERVSVRSDGSQPQYTATGLNNSNRNPSVNDDGTVIAFESTNRDLAPEASPVPGDTWQQYDIYVRDIANPVVANRLTERITVGVGGVKANGSSSDPIVSPDGRYVWFTSAASNLIVGDTNGRTDLFVHDRFTHVTSRVDVTAGTGLPLDGDVILADVSPNGRWIAFSSAATTIVPNDANGQIDAFRLDTLTSTVEIASPALAPLGNGASFATAVSDDGRHVAFQSAASNLVPGDLNSRVDIFVADVLTNATQRVSLVNGNERNGASSSATITADARSLVYMHQAAGDGFFTIWRAELAVG